MFKNCKYLVVGSGFSGSVLAERIASVLNEPVIVVEKRKKCGGNASSTIDSSTGIEIHDYGSHIFHTKERNVWDYIRQFGEFTGYRHKVLISCRGKIYFMPINLKTIQDFTGKMFCPADAEKWVKNTIPHDLSSPQNLEEKGVSLIGKPLYDTFIAGYTQKQWGRSPKDLPPEIITRLPVRFNFNSNYFNDPYQGIPEKGYDALFRKMLSHPNIQVLYNTDFKTICKQIPNSCIVFYTGMIDEFFDYSLGHLEWRSLRFEYETVPVKDFQGTSVMNYADLEIPFTRIHEYKHYHPEWTECFENDKTVICREYPEDWAPGKEAYYPVNDYKNQKKLADYQKLALKNKNVIFCGRLASYKYWDMDQAVFAAMKIFQHLIQEVK